MQLTCPRCGTASTLASSTTGACQSCGGSLAPSNTEVTAGYEPKSLGTEAWTGSTGEGDAPDTVGGYRIIRLLGRGGMGRVFEAEDAATGERVAVKLLADRLEDRPEALERFRLEGRLAARVGGPRVVFVLTADEDAGRPFIVMELMPGDNLQDVVARRGPLPIIEAIEFTLDTLDGLAAAHKVGVVHRDVKPSNCFLDADGRVKVGDFGLAQALADPATEGGFAGTPQYAAPEQAAGTPADGQSDQYSLAATLYFLLTGRPPVRGGKTAEVLDRVKAGDIRPLRELRPDLPPALAEVVHRGLACDPAQRWPDLSAFRRALIEFVPERQEQPSLVARFLTVIADLLICAPVIYLLNFAVAAAIGLPTSLIDSPDLPKQVVSFVVAFAGVWLYFTLLEVVGSGSLGKRMFGLRVRSADGSPITLRQAAVRHAVFCGLYNAGGYAAIGQAWWQSENGPVGPEAMALANSLATLVGFLLLLAPMLVGWGRRGLHERLSGTRVAVVPSGSVTATIERVEPQPTPALSGPTRIGSYQVLGGLPAAGEVETLLGADPVLGRQVVILLAPLGAGNAPEARRKITSLSRLRWLTGGTVTDRAWDAFTAPEGTPITGHISSAGPRPWGEARPFLADLTAELTAAVRDGTLPPDLSEDNVWVRPDGCPLLLDVPAGPRVAPVLAGSDADRAVGLLRRVAGLVVEGRPRPPEPSVSFVAARLPRRAARALAGLFASPDEGTVILRAWRDILTALRVRPAGVTRINRLLCLVIQAGLTFCWLPMVSFSGVAEVVHAYSMTTPPDDGTLSAAVRRDADELLISTAVNPDPRVRLVGVAVWGDDYRTAYGLDRLSAERRAAPPVRIDNLGPVERSFTLPLAGKAVSTVPESVKRSPRDHARYLYVRYSGPATSLLPQTMFLATLLLGPIALLSLVSFLSRGGLTLRLTGFALVRRDGQLAGRFRCTARTLASWFPCVALLFASVGLKFAFPEDELLPAWAWWASVGAWWAGFGVLIAQTVEIVVHPDRCFADRVVGTYLVPA